MSVSSLPYILCEGSPYAMGMAYGQQACDAIQYNLSFMRSRWRAVARNNWAEELRSRLAAHLPDVLQELQGLAKGADVCLDELLRYNHWLGDQQCTTVALVNSPDGPLVGKNNDGMEDLRFVVRHSRPEQGFAMLQVTYAGWLSGLDSLNAAGLGCMHASVGSVFNKQGNRVDIRLVAYDLLRRISRTQALVDAIRCFPLTGKGYNIIIQDAQGDTQVVEAAVPMLAVRETGDANFVYTTNHYQTDALMSSDRRPAAKKAISQYRYGYLIWRESECPPVNASDLSEVLSSHVPWAPCRHGGLHGSRTIWSAIAQPAQRRMLVSHGPPCANAYQAYDLEPSHQPASREQPSTTRTTTGGLL